MGWFSPDIATMDDLFVHALQDMYYAERQSERALPDMVQKASDGELKKAFQTHLRQTKTHIKRLEQVFKKLKLKPSGTDCPAIDGILNEANEIAADVRDKVVMNAALIGAAQAVEHYEITRYGTLIAWAKALGHTDAAQLFAANLREEKATDKKLNGIAKRKVNRKAVARRPKPMSRREQEAMLAASVGVPTV